MDNSFHSFLGLAARAGKIKTGEETVLKQKLKQLYIGEAEAERYMRCSES